MVNDLENPPGPGSLKYREAIVNIVTASAGSSETRAVWVAVDRKSGGVIGVRGARNS